MEESLELCVSYGDVRKLVVLDSKTTFSKLKSDLQVYFGLQTQGFQLIEIKRNAEIISIKSLKPENEIKILFNHDLAVDPVVLPTDVQEEAHSKPPNKIGFDDLLEKKFKESSFLTVMNQWAGEKKFHLIFGSKQKMKVGFKRFLLCQVKSCEYKIIFKSDKREKYYKIYEKLSKKYSEHSILFY